MFVKCIEDREYKSYTNESFSNNTKFRGITKGNVYKILSQISFATASDTLVHYYQILNDDGISNYVRKDRFTLIIFNKLKFI